MFFTPPPPFNFALKSISRELPLLDDVTVAIVQKHQNGDEDQTEQEPFATLVVYVGKFLLCVEKLLTRAQIMPS